MDSAGFGLPILDVDDPVLAHELTVACQNWPPGSRQGEQRGLDRVGA